MQPKRIVIKVGTHCLVHEDSNGVGGFSQESIHAIFSQVQRLQQAGYQTAVVISGAVASGRFHYDLPSRQAQASHGQWLMNEAIATYTHNLNTPFGLLLLSREDLRNRQRYTTLQETFEHLFSRGIVPLINENDATTIKDKNDFPDNDYLAALVAISIDAQALFLLTNVDGVYSGDPTQNNATLIHEIENVNAEILSRINATKSSMGRGGMLGKLTAARLATATGVETYIINGEQPEQIIAILEQGMRYGTHCKSRLHANQSGLSASDRWLVASKASDGSIQIDQGAAQALRQRKSLLAIGIHHIYGTFHAHETVEVLDDKRETIAIGLTKLSSVDLQELVNNKSSAFDVEVIHANNLILI